MDLHSNWPTIPTRDPSPPGRTTPAYEKTLQIPPRVTLSGRAGERSSFNVLSPALSAIHRRVSRLDDFRGQQILHLFTAANEAMLLPFHQHFGRTESRVVIRTLRHAVGARIEQRQEVARFHRLHHPVTRKEVPGLADRSNHIDCSCPAGAWLQRHNLV